MTYREHLRIVKLMAERDCYRECLDKLRSAVMGRDVTARGMGDKQLHEATDEAVDAVRTRLMPEGMEWPRYEDGETFIPGDDRSVEFFVDGIFSVWINDDHQHLGPGERVKRPQVLAADGEPLERGLDAWWICEGDDRGIHAERLRVERIGEDGLVECSPYSGGTWVELDPGELYAERPVPDADGVPIKAGYVLHHISGLGNGVTVRQVMPPGCFEDTEFKRHIATEYTHIRPERDSWERVEDDATKQPYAYCVERGLDDDALPTNEKFGRDLVRRCKALAGVSE